MSLEALQVIVVVCPYGCLLDSSVHPLGLTIGRKRRGETTAVTACADNDEAR